VVAERRRADDEAATAKAVIDFLQGDLLAQASANTQAGPNTKPDPDLKVRTALDRAAARIAGKFEKQPLVEAAIRWTIGGTYEELGLYPEAREQFKAARALRAEVLGEEHPDTVTAMFALAQVYLYEEKIAAAQPLLNKVVEVRRRILGEEHRETLTSMNSLAATYSRDGKYAPAEELQAKALEIRRRVLGPQLPDTTDTMASLSELWLLEHRYTESEPVLREALNTVQQISPGSWERYYLRSLLGAALTGQKRYAEAQPLLLSGYTGMIELQTTIPAFKNSNLTQAGEWIVNFTGTGTSRRKRPNGRPNWKAKRPRRRRSFGNRSDSLHGGTATFSRLPCLMNLRGFTCQTTIRSDSLPRPQSPLDLANIQR
jgi:tetratricopeptide (TPR) repeat protein